LIRRLSYPVLALGIFLALLGSSTAHGQNTPKTPSTAGPSANDPGPMARQVRSEFLYAWNAYKQYAWGHDELLPLTQTGRDWYGVSLEMTPVDALDTMLMMGLKEEADKTRQSIEKDLSFNRDIYVSNFEITIRLLGGLLSSYQLTHDQRLLDMAQDLGTRLLPAFNSPTGMPYRFVNLKTGKTRGAESNPAEIGTLLVEFGTLSRLTGKQVFYDKAKRAVTELYSRRSKIGLVGRKSTLKPASGLTQPAASAAALIPTTNICSSRGCSSGTRTASACGRPA
jgi:mannosidase alpha-like ER degradation enhancer 2